VFVAEESFQFSEQLSYFWDHWKENFTGAFNVTQVLLQRDVSQEIQPGNTTQINIRVFRYVSLCHSASGFGRFEETCCLIWRMQQFTRNNRCGRNEVGYLLGLLPPCTFLAMSVTTLPSSRRHVPRKSSPQLRRCQSLISSTVPAPEHTHRRTNRSLALALVW